ncbi:MAG TPA: MFS transporter [Candidatus Binataceae bacterium]|nr:MFS transporter [Candidatus Binataceae bacterium]
MADSSAAHSGGLKGYFAANRTLETYPTGAHRWGMLLLTVMATVVSFYEFGFSLLPLWLSTLHFTLPQFGHFLAFAVLLSGVSAMYGGPLADRHGRVVVIDVCLAVMIVLTFANLLMTGFWSFVIVRALMNVVAGLSWGALGGLTRDMSPRVSRGVAFGLLTLGAVACQFLWNFLPGLTLPYFPTWQAQIWIMGVLAVVIYIPVFFFLKDLAPNLRLMVIDSEQTGAAYESGEIAQGPSSVPMSAAQAFGELLSHWSVWALAIGAVGFLSIALTVQNFGSEMFAEAYKYDTATATSAVSKFWLLNGVMLVPAGYLSDWLGMRKPVSLILTLFVLAGLAWWIPTFNHPLPPGQLNLVVLAMGALTASAYIPWTAQFSELLEDISPALQATGWSFFQMVFRVWIAATGILIPYVSRYYGWATWMWIAFAAVCMFVAAQLSVRGYWRSASAPPAPVRDAPAHAAGG